ncbi:MAG: NAD(P)/FAD-dependent oxidoreductase [Dermatophilaceae bacterium]
MAATVLVLGANFAGLTAAIGIRNELGPEADVTVISPRESFLFTPSLIWLPFGKRTARDLTFPVAPTLEAHDVDLVPAEATGIDPVAHHVATAAGGVHPYDYLVVATGYRNDVDVVPGFEDHAVTITTLQEAERAGLAWRRFLESPGDVVVAATQGASCFGAAYEFLFNVSYQLRRAGLHREVQLTYVSAEPFLGHFGIGGLPHGERLLGMFLRKEGIEHRLDTAIDSVEDGALILADGEKLPFHYGMVVPPFLGQSFLTEVPGLTDATGFVRVRDTYQSATYDDIYGIGAAAAVEAPWQTPTPVGIPKTGFPTEVQARVAVRNIAAQVRGEQPTETKLFGDIPAVCVMDAGNNGVLILADRMLPPRTHGVLVPGPQAHLMKLGFEKYYLWKMRHGYVGLP